MNIGNPVFDVERGGIYWALINNEPKKVKYISLLPYNGFEYIEPYEPFQIRYYENGPILGFNRVTIVTEDKAQFFATKEDLIVYHIRKTNETIEKQEKELARFMGMCLTEKE